MTEETTKTFERKTMEETLSKLADYLGTKDLDMIKMFSIMTKDGIRKKAMMLGDIDGYKFARRLKPYAFQDLFLNVSEGGTGRTHVVDVVKTPFQNENMNEKGRLQKLVDLFR